MIIPRKGSNYVLKIQWLNYKCMNYKVPISIIKSPTDHCKNMALNLYMYDVVIKW